MKQMGFFQNEESRWSGVFFVCFFGLFVFLVRGKKSLSCGFIVGFKISKAHEWVRHQANLFSASWLHFSSLDVNDSMLALSIHTIQCCNKKHSKQTKTYLPKLKESSHVSLYFLKFHVALFGSPYQPKNSYIVFLLIPYHLCTFLLDRQRPLY